MNCKNRTEKSGKGLSLSLLGIAIEVEKLKACCESMKDKSVDNDAKDKVQDDAIAANRDNTVKGETVVDGKLYLVLEDGTKVEAPVATDVAGNKISY